MNTFIGCLMCWPIRKRKKNHVQTPTHKKVKNWKQRQTNFLCSNSRNVRVKLRKIWMCSSNRKVHVTSHIWIFHFKQLNGLQIHFRHLRMPSIIYWVVSMYTAQCTVYTLHVIPILIASTSYLFERRKKRTHTHKMMKQILLGFAFTVNESNKVRLVDVWDCDDSVCQYFFHWLSSIHTQIHLFISVTHVVIANTPKNNWFLIWSSPHRGRQVRSYALLVTKS